MLVIAARLFHGLWRMWHTRRADLEGESWLVAAGVAGSMAAGAVVLGITSRTGSVCDTVIVGTRCGPCGACDHPAALTSDVDLSIARKVFWRHAVVAREIRRLVVKRRMRRVDRHHSSRLRPHQGCILTPQQQTGVRLQGPHHVRDAPGVVLLQQVKHVDAVAGLAVLSKLVWRPDYGDASPHVYDGIPVASR